MLLCKDKNKKCDIIVQEIDPKCRHKIENKKLIYGKNVKNIKIL